MRNHRTGPGQGIGPVAAFTIVTVSSLLVIGVGGLIIIIHMATGTIARRTYILAISMAIAACGGFMIAS